MTVDGQPLADKLDGTALAAGPGEHTFTFETVGRSPVVQKPVIREGDRGRRERITLGAESHEAETTITIKDSTEAPPPANTQRIAGFVLGGTGIVGLEWEYAAAGGDLSRLYPWGPQAPGIKNEPAIYGCYSPTGNSDASCEAGVGSIAPVGTQTQGFGAWVTLDLVGNLVEWILDYYTANYTGTCNDCAYLDLIEDGGTARHPRRRLPRLRRPVPLSAQPTS